MNTRMYLEELIHKCNLLPGKKIHALMAMALYPGKTYEDILASKGSAFDMYSRGKRAVFAMLYGGDHNTTSWALS